MGASEGWSEVPRALRHVFRYERALIYGDAGVLSLGSADFAAFVAEATKAGVLPQSMALLAPRLDFLFSHPFLRPAALAVQEAAAEGLRVAKESKGTFPIILDHFDASNTVVRAVVIELACLFLLKKSAMRGTSGTMRTFREILGGLQADREALIGCGQAGGALPQATSVVTLLSGLWEDESAIISCPAGFVSVRPPTRGRGQGFHPHRGGGRGGMYGRHSGGRGQQPFYGQQPPHLQPSSYGQQPQYQQYGYPPYNQQVQHTLPPLGQNPAAKTASAASA